MEEVRLGRYELFSLIGRGSVGVVYRARDTKLKRTVAVKVLRQAFLAGSADAQGILARFERECMVASALCHPNIVTILDSGHTDIGLPYFVMEYIPGTSLLSVLQHGQLLTPGVSLKYLRQLASAVDYAHERGVMHRDIKPSNVIIDEFDTPRLLDFSTAKFVRTQATVDGTLLGTPGYISPEQINGDDVDHRTDLYALGVLAYELLTGSLPFPGDGMMCAVNTVVNERPVAVQSLNPTLPHYLDLVFAKALAKNRENRYHSAGAFVKDLQRAFGLHQQEMERIENLLGSGPVRDERIPPHILGRDRRDSFGRTGRTIAGFFEKYLCSQIGMPQNRPQIGMESEPQIPSRKSSRWSQVFRPRSQDPFAARNTPMLNWLLILGISACAYPISAAFMQADNSLHAVASTQHYPQNQGSAYGDLRNAFSPRLTAAATSGYFAEEVGRSSIARNTDWLTLAIDPPREQSSMLLAKINSTQPGDATPAMEELVLELVNHDDFGVRISAVKRLGSLRHVNKHRIIAVLADLLEDPDRIVRAHACRALARTGNRQALALLRAKQGLDNDPLVQRVIAYSLKRSANRSA